MANFGYYHSVEDFAPSEDWSVIPPGDYNVMIVESAMKPTKNGSGEYLELKMQVIDGPYSGRSLWERLNIRNANPTAQSIAQRKLSSILRAFDITGTQDSTILHGRPMVAVVAVKPAGPDKNGIFRKEQQEVSSFRAAGSAGTASVPASPPMLNSRPAQENPDQRTNVKAAAPVAGFAPPSLSGSAPWRKSV